LMPSSPQRRAFDGLKGYLYASAPSEFVRLAMEKELDLLYRSWYELADAHSGPVRSATRRHNPEERSESISEAEFVNTC
jgi:hypothetical protein